jgi:RNA polymerase sigma-70 factor (ECF subfamily)
VLFSRIRGMPLGPTMGDELPVDLTRVVNDLDSKDRPAVEALLPMVYADLRRLADSFFQRERDDHTLQPTALVHEAYLRLVKAVDGKYESRVHFFRAAAVTMRHILLNHARDHARLKRGGDMDRVTLTDHAAPAGEDSVELLSLDEALKKLALRDARQAQIVELRFFAGLSVAEAADVIGVSKRTAEDDWALAKAWLWREMNR